MFNKPTSEYLGKRLTVTFKLVEDILLGLIGRNWNLRLRRLERLRFRLNNLRSAITRLTAGTDRLLNRKESLLDPYVTSWLEPTRVEPLMGLDVFWFFTFHVHWRNNLHFHLNFAQ
jgi:hypothetical protein